MCEECHRNASSRKWQECVRNVSVMSHSDAVLCVLLCKDRSWSIMLGQFCLSIYVFMNSVNFLKVPHCACTWLGNMAILAIWWQSTFSFKIGVYVVTQKNKFWTRSVSMWVRDKELTSQSANQCWGLEFTNISWLENVLRFYTISSPMNSIRMWITKSLGNVLSNICFTEI